ncbi:multifunctional CCA addition/repair protein [Rhodocyclus tenuis]|uniref:Multifunctional CCA protein n=1 Tax=Rhodocyclus tenuis TaxID=1066 RepID=A0A840G2D2_RHOTE|nr:multifunctional CCA addition/repair protein [Rhodocyclus tenuis]MBB4246116.1 tRNA nucleotidyltransferase (CCA-adding enzyme) [Rhodocyclus tenuis]
MQIYTVGGAVRDELLGLPVKDRDHVVVGATPEILLAQGFRPVGRDFPVFLHPQTHEEYALARTERKSGSGYTGFTVHAAPEVTLEEDLARRDLTINAIARAADGTLIDPFGGIADIKARQLRHVGPAFVEDPVRILRIARFAARFSLPPNEFAVAPETAQLMRQMTAAGEVDHLVAERVWQELARGLMEEKPSRFFRVLRDCGALARLLPELDALFGVPQRADFHPEIDTGEHALLVVDQAARHRLPLAGRLAALLHDLGKALTPADVLPRHHGHEARGIAPTAALCARLKVPAECRELALLATRFHGQIHLAGELRPATIATLLEHTDALRRPQRFATLLDVCVCDHRGRGGHEDAAYSQRELLLRALDAVRGVDAAAVVRGVAEAARIPERLHAARTDAIRRALANGAGTCASTPDTTTAA